MIELLSKKKTGGFGFVLIRALVGQLRGSLELRREGGTEFVIQFHLPAVE
jgi:two-component sensor histidine kinase